MGGKGEVFLAEDDRLERRVALKVLTSDGTSPERARELRNEVRAISSLNHPRILTIYEVGSEDGVDYMATEYVDGENLREHLVRGPLGVRQAVEVGVALAEALTAAHEAGVIHGDIKPENVMLRRDGHVKVLDFGVARLARSKEPSAPFEGTVHYVAPEILLGAKPGERSDIFSFGVLLYEILVGEPPFDGETMDGTRSAILSEEPRRLRRLNRQVPASLEEIVDRALTKDPASRYQNASKLLIELQRVKRELDAGELQRAFGAGTLTGRLRLRLAGWALAAGFTLLAAAAGIGWLMNNRHPPTASQTLAVLPFENRAGDERTEVLADGLTESLINELSRFPNLRVTARRSVYQSAGKGLDPRRIGRELGVGVVLIGALRRRESDVVISAELLDVVKGERVWTETYRRQSGNLVALEQQIARSIAEALRTTLAPSVVTRTGSPDAHFLYLEGRYYWNERTIEGFKQAIESFNAAIDRDSSYAAAHAGLADAYNLLGTYGGMTPADAFPRARSAARRAIELDPNLAEAHTSLAYALQNYDWDWEAADREYRRALALSPSYAVAHHWYGGFLMLMGRFNEAIAHRNEAVRLDPLSPQFHAARGSPFLLSRRYADAIDAYRKALALDPRLGRVHLSIASAMLYSGDLKGALAEIDRARALSGDTPEAKADLAYAWARAGRAEDAEAILRELKRSARRQYVDPYEFARIEVALGKHDAALDDLERAFQMRSNLMMNLKVDPALDPLRGTARFQDLLRRMRFP
jgi:eukaryotic-like serine/threonine-protein kinase